MRTKPGSGKQKAPGTQKRTGTGILCSAHGNALCGEVVFQIGNGDLAEVEQRGGQHRIRFAQRERIGNCLLYTSHNALAAAETEIQRIHMPDDAHKARRIHTQPRQPGIHTVPVSYTHLDVYKRQALNFNKQQRRVQGFPVRGAFFIDSAPDTSPQ